jgi:hypothetical protein
MVGGRLHRRYISGCEAAERLATTTKGKTMTKRIQRMLVTVAALAALALGGAVLAQAQTSPSSAPERTSLLDRDNVQAGNQTGPDTPAKRAATVRAPRATRETDAGSESAAPNDGPGGHADEPGAANVDHVFQGNE